MKSTSIPRLGIVQGRLIQSPAGALQWFPQDHWTSEFFLANAIGLDYIEFIAERDHNPQNPIWTESGISQIQSLTKQNNLSIEAMCNDYVIDHPMIGNTQQDALEQCRNLLNQCSRLGIRKFILPLFENGELNTSNFKDFKEPLTAIARLAQKHNIQICLETILDGTQLLQFLEFMDLPNVKAVFDTGNRVAFGHDLSGDIKKLGSAISHVHIKDKNKENQNVLLGTGLVNFFEVFCALNAINYTGPFTFETFRGSNPIQTAKYNIHVVNFFKQETDCFVSHSNEYK